MSFGDQTYADCATFSDVGDESPGAGGAAGACQWEEIVSLNRFDGIFRIREIDNRLLKWG